MTDSSDKIIRPVGNLRIPALRSYGYEQQPPGDRSAKKHKQDNPDSDDSTEDKVCIITPEKVDCKI